MDSTHPYFTTTSLSDGRIVVNDMHRLVFYDKDGGVLYTRGRECSGPGEFGQVIAICIIDLPFSAR